MSEVAELFVKIGANLSDFDDGMKESQKELNKFGRNMTKLGQEVTRTANDSMKNLSKEFEVWRKESGLAEDSVESLAKKLEMQEKASKELESAARTQEQIYERLVQAYGETSKQAMKQRERVLDLKNAYQDLQEEITQTKTKMEGGMDANGIEEAGNKFEGVNDAVTDLLGDIEGLGQFAGKGGIIGGVALAIAGVGLAALKSADQVQQASGTIEARLGATKQDSEELAEAAKGIYKDGFGESLQSVAKDLSIVSVNMRNMPKEEIQKVTEYAETLAETFDSDVVDSTKTANQLMKTFGLTSDEAFDLLTTGYQKGLDFSGEFLDTVNEYAPQFKAMGMSAEDMFNVLIAGSEAGAFNLDKVGDAVKEFNIRVKDGSKTTAEGFGQLSKATQQVWNDFLKGKKTGEEVFKTVINELANMEDKVKANQIGVSLFGKLIKLCRSKIVQKR
ncbi:phage tail tape measure protein [Bacillus sp. OTU530]|uniref:phage tail tape measure protein n=1 Tax=Bacillus sp. OTU530 TaxID=3043862 RepID=UPI00313E2E8D